MALTPEEREAIERIANDAHKNIKKMVNLVRPPEPEPEPLDVIALLVEADADLSVLSDPVRHQGILREFARRIWAEAYSTAATDISSCCGCIGKDRPNPFEEAPDA